MSKTLINKNPHTGIEHWAHDNPDGPETVIETIYDREPVLEHAAFMRNEVKQTGDGPRKIGSIPLTLWFRWMREGKLGEVDENGVCYAVDPEKARAMLNDPEYKLLKTIDGQA